MIAGKNMEDISNPNIDLWHETLVRMNNNIFNKTSNFKGIKGENPKKVFLMPLNVKPFYKTR